MKLALAVAFAALVACANAVELTEDQVACMDRIEANTHKYRRENTPQAIRDLIVTVKASDNYYETVNLCKAGSNIDFFIEQKSEDCKQFFDEHLVSGDAEFLSWAEESYPLTALTFKLARECEVKKDKIAKIMGLPSAQN